MATTQVSCGVKKLKSYHSGNNSLNSTADCSLNSCSLCFRGGRRIHMREKCKRSFFFANLNNRSMSHSVSALSHHNPLALCLWVKRKERRAPAICLYTPFIHFSKLQIVNIQTFRILLGEMVLLLQQVQHLLIQPVSLPEPRVLFLLVLLSSWYHGKITKQEAYNLLMTGTVPPFLTLQQGS